jgi:glycosyltransferase involved in cell wall biosynthesis
MRILIVNPYAVGPDEAGITRPYNFAKALRRLGHDPVVLTSSFDHFSQRFDRLDGWHRVRREEVNGVPFVWMRTLRYRGNDWKRAANMLGFGASILNPEVLRETGRPDVVMGSSPHILAAGGALALARRLGVPHVMEVRDPWPQILVDAGQYSESHPAIRTFRRLERMLYRHSESVVSVYPFLSKYLVAHGCRRDRITWVPNGIDNEFLPEVRPPEASSPPRTTFLYAGSHGLANGLELLLEVADRIRTDTELGSVTIRLMGDGPRKPGLRAEAQRRGLTQLVFSDPVPKREVYAAMQTADAFLQVLIDSPVFAYGPSPNKLVDYMVSARPTLFVSNSPFNPVRDAKAGFTADPSRPETLVEAMRLVVRMSREDRWAMGLRGRAHIVEHFDLDVLAHRLGKVFEAAVARRPAPEPRGLGAAA